MLAPALMPLLLAAFTPVFAERISAPSGELRLGVGTLSEPLPGELRAAARGYALSRRAELGLPLTSTLGPPEAFGTRFGASIHLMQQVDGVDVHGAKVVVTLDRFRRVVQVSSSLVPYRQAVLDWRLGAAQALSIAAGEVPLAMLQPNGMPFGGSRREIFRVGDEVHSGYLTFVPSLDLTQNWFIAIDATDGRVLWRQNRVFHAADEAQVYASNPGGLDAGVGHTPLLPVRLVHSDGGSLLVANDGGHLEGDQLVSYGCCPNQGCATGPDAGPKRADGGLQYSGLTIQYTVVECDRVQRASNDPALNPAGNFLYPPLDPPALVGGVPGPVVQEDPADSDPFSEVMAFYQVNAVYDFVRTLSEAAAPLFPGNAPPIEGFKTRDAKRSPPRNTAVWSNITLPDYEELQANISIVGCMTGGPCTTHSNKLTRVDNAAYMARENFSQIMLPDYMLDVDTLMIFQGNRADWGYDAPVLWHEFGHGMVYATAAFESLAIDARSANNEGGAMHEGFADYLAGVFGNDPRMGEYVGPRAAQGGNTGNLAQEPALRNLENSFACPEVLWGEVHQDSQHFSAALWQARKQWFMASDQGRTFDAAVYAALVSMTPATDFSQAAAIIAAHLPAAFPGVPQADLKMKAIFDQRGVTNCSKVVDMTGVSVPLPLYGIGGPQAAGLSGVTLVPGPYQMKLQLPKGASSVSVNAKAGGGMPPGQSGTSARLLARVGSPITFTRVGNTLTHDAEVTAKATVAASNLSAKAVIAADCGAELYLTLGTQAGGGETLRELTVSVEPAAQCVADAGTDAGAPEPSPDGGAGDGGATSIPSINEGGRAGAGRVPAGCGCASSDLGLSALAMLGLARLVGFRRRRTRQ